MALQLYLQNRVVLPPYDRITSLIRKPKREKIPEAISESQCGFGKHNSWSNLI